MLISKKIGRMPINFLIYFWKAIAELSYKFSGSKKISIKIYLRNISVGF